MSRVRVRVPATVANLGPGFDAVGVALAMYLEVEATEAEKLNVSVHGGDPGLPRDRTNLVVSAMDLYARTVGVAPLTCQLLIRPSIPLAAGLGSSAAAVIAGLVVARALCEAEPLDDAGLLALAATAEGHPDNVVPALLGGLAVCVTEHDGPLQWFRVEPSARLRPVVVHRHDGFSTAEARRVLPTSVPFDDAGFTVARAALLPIALQAGGPPELVAAALGDRLHQPYRLARMPQSAALYDALWADGVPVVLAGAGPSLLALVDADADDAVARIQHVCENQGAGWQVSPSAWDLTGTALL